MLFQLFHEFRDGHIDWLAQSEFPDDGSSGDYSTWVQRWITDVKTRHPLPKDAGWLVCDQTAPCFVTGRATGKIFEQEPA